MARGELPTPPEGAGRCDGSDVAGQPHAIHGAWTLVAWEPGVPEAHAQLALSWVEDALSTFVVDHGWRAPLGLERWRVPLTVRASRLGGGLMVVRRCGGGAYPEIEIGLDAFDDLDAGFELVAHEVMHVLQAAYGGRHERWFHEATATWAERLVGGTTWMRYADAFGAQPQLGLETSLEPGDPSALHMYGRALWLTHLEQALGGPQAVRALWEARERVQGEGDQRALLDAMGHDFEAQFQRFALRVPVMDFAAGLAEAHAEDVALLPAEGECLGTRCPQRDGQWLLRFDPPAEGVGLRVSLDLAPGPVWRHWLVGERDGRVVRAVPFETEAQTLAAELERAWVYDSVWVIVSPGGDELSPASRWRVSWSAASFGGVVFGPEVSASRGCAQAASAARLGGVWLLLGLVALRRRR